MKVGTTDPGQLPGFQRWQLKVNFHRAFDIHI